MKLIDLLVQELPKRGGWPEGVNRIHQDHDGEVYAWQDSSCKLLFRLGIIADNCRAYGTRESIEDMVTREQYESALAASKAVVGHDGWIQWAGGECPVDSDAIVELKYRWHNQHQYSNDRAGDFDWAHTGSSCDIIAYRLQKPTKSEQVRADAWRSYAGITEKDDEADLNECIGQDLDPAWSGNGMPPVGAKVEFFINPNFGYRNDWIPDAGTEMEVVAHKTTTDGNDVAVCYWDEGGAGRSCCFVPGSLKPLRTESEKAREAGIKEMLRVVTNYNKTDVIRAIEQLYDAGYRKEVK